MKQVMVSQDVYDQLKGFIVDPFEDTLETVIARLMMIARKARDRWMELHDGKDAVGCSGTIDDLPDIIGDDEVEADKTSSSGSQFQCRDIGEPSTL
ncbi:MAG: hypothetical protein JW709_07885 [Sedimentisphaerales bacterium]|nr:hypothetical protein [Sedimentisphaerales bacterium]